MTKTITLSSLLALALAGFFSGCRTIDYDNSGKNYAVFQLGDFKGLVNTTAPKTAEAVQKAVQQSDLFQTYVVVNKYEAQVLARDRADNKIRINIEENNSRQTLINIRWGQGGDYGNSRKFFDKVNAILVSAGIN